MKEVAAEYTLHSVNGTPTSVLRFSLSVVVEDHVTIPPLALVLPFARKYAATQIGELQAELIDAGDLVLERYWVGLRG